MLTNVDPKDVLFGTVNDSATYSLVPHMRGKNIGEGHIAIALSQYGSGSVSFFGDMKHEDETLKIMSNARGF